MARINSHGTTLVETLIALPVLIATLSGVFAVIYLSVAQAWLKDAAEDACLCMAEKVSSRVCKAEFRDKTALALPIGHFTRLAISADTSSVNVNYEFKVAQVDLKNEISLSLPVSKRKVGVR